MELTTNLDAPPSPAGAAPSRRPDTDDGLA